MFVFRGTATSFQHAPVRICLLAALVVQGCALPELNHSKLAQKRGSPQVVADTSGDAPQGSVVSTLAKPAGSASTGDSVAARENPVTIQVSANVPGEEARKARYRKGQSSHQQQITSTSWNPVPTLSADDDTPSLPKLLDPASGQPLVLRRVNRGAVRAISGAATRSQSSRADPGVLQASFEVGEPPEPAADPQDAPQNLPGAQTPQGTQRNPQNPGSPPPTPEPAPGPGGLQPTVKGQPSSGDGTVHIPLAGSDPGDNINLTMRNGRVSLVVRNAPVQSVLNLLAQQQGVNLIAADDVIGNISVTLTNVAFEDALGSIVAIAGCTWTQQKGIVLVTKIGGNVKGIPGVQGKVVQVFPLNFVSAVDIETTIKGLLSPVGQIFVSQTTPKDQRRTQELVVLEDLPDSVARVGQYIQQIDQPPRQVMIEAHILQVELKDDTRHGVDWKYITTIAGRDVAVKSVGFTNPLSSPAAMFSLSGEHLNLVIEALKTTTDAKTLASPKIIVANGQEARIQIGDKLGYFVTTTTQTSTLQNVNFLNTGVVLKVMPQISNDGRVLMQIKPEVSTGKISSLGLPETKTTEAETTVLMEDGGGMVIGGLIKETDNDTQDKVPILGDMWAIGRLFQKRVISRERSEIVIVLIPKIAPYCSPDERTKEGVDFARTQIPLFKNGLQPVDRSFEPRLPDAINNPRRFRASRLSALTDNPSENNPKPLRYFFPTSDEEMLPDGALVHPARGPQGFFPPPPMLPPADETVIERTLPTGSTIRLRRPAGSPVQSAAHSLPAGAPQ